MDTIHLCRMLLAVLVLMEWSSTGVHLAKGVTADHTAIRQAQCIVAPEKMIYPFFFPPKKTVRLVAGPPVRF